jgi:hypothetical protein
MLPAELAVLVHLNPFRIVALVLLGHIVATLAFCASQCYLHSHYRHLLLIYSSRTALQWERFVCLPLIQVSPAKRHKRNPCKRGKTIISHFPTLVKQISEKIYTPRQKAKKCRFVNDV